MIYGYIRVSTGKQNLDNQEFEIINFCQRENFLIDCWIRETVSGSKSFEERRLGVLLRRLKSGDILIASEISRLGRNLFQIMSILNICMQKNVQVRTIKDNYKLGADLQSKVLAFAFGLAAEIERDLISQRTRESLLRLKSCGHKLGRAFGSKNKKHVLDGKENEIFQLLAQGVSKTRIAESVGVSTKTIYNFLSRAKDRKI